VSSTGEVSKVAGEETFKRMIIVDPENPLHWKSATSEYWFFCADSTAGGPTSTSHAYGVRNGEVVEVPFDVDYLGNVRYDEELQKPIGFVSVLDNGRKFQKYGFEFDSDTFSFRTTGTIGVPDYSI
jgi:hypothetical protein